MGLQEITQDISKNFLAHKLAKHIQNDATFLVSMAIKHFVRSVPLVGDDRPRILVVVFDDGTVPLLHLLSELIVAVVVLAKQ